MQGQFQVFWLVWCMDGGAPLFKHATREAANKEAERLAGIHAPNTFVVMEAMAAVRKSDMQWFAPCEACEVDGIPF